MRVLVSGHGEDRVALDAARRSVPYDKLVLITSKPDAKELKALHENEELAGIRLQMHAVDKDDFTGTLATANDVIDAENRTSVVVHVAGGPNLVTSALLLASFQRGVTAFYCHERGVSYLPVIRAASFIERFDATQRHILVALPRTGQKQHEDLVPPGVTLSVVRGALRGLKTNGLVDADARSASLTTTGAYYRAHLASLRTKPKA